MNDQMNSFLSITNGVLGNKKLKQKEKENILNCVVFELYRPSLMEYNDINIWINTLKAWEKEYPDTRLKGYSNFKRLRISLRSSLDEIKRNGGVKLLSKFRDKVFKVLTNKAKESYIDLKSFPSLHI